VIFLKNSKGGLLWAKRHVVVVAKVDELTPKDPVVVDLQLLARAKKEDSHP